MPYMRVVVRPGAESHINVSAVTKHVAEEVAADARLIVPVDEGDLKSTIRVEDAGDGKARVVAGGEHGHVTGKPVDYAGYVELGTRYMEAQPYLKPSLYRWRGRVA